MQIGLWDVKGRAAAVRRVPIFPTGEVMVLLEEAVPLRALLAPLDAFSEQLMAALEALQPDHAREFGLGSAMHAVMDYLVRYMHAISSIRTCPPDCSRLLVVTAATTRAKHV